MDDADRSEARMELEMDLALDAIRRDAVIPAGTAGDCDLCGEWSGRLINGVCAPCRDKHQLP